MSDDGVDIFVWAKNYRPPDRYITTSLLWKISFSYVMFVIIVAVILHFWQNGLYIPAEEEADSDVEEVEQPDGDDKIEE